MGIEIHPEQEFILRLVEDALDGRSEMLFKYVDNNVVEANDLAIIDVSALHLIATLVERVKQFRNIPFLEVSTWQSILADAKYKNYPFGGVNPEWVDADIEEFMSEVVNPRISGVPVELLIPAESSVRKEANDEYRVHAAAVVISAASAIRGISRNVGNYGSEKDIIKRLREYFAILARRGEKAEAFVLDEHERVN